MTVIRFNAGHGRGKKYNRGGIKFNEGDENYNFTGLLLEKLSSYDVDAKELRHSKGNGEFERDWDTIRNWGSGADLFYSAHSNAFNGQATGVEVFLSYKSIKYYNFAKELTEVISKTLGIYNRGVKFQNRNTGSYETYSQANSSKNDWLNELYLNKAKCVVLVEHFFHDNINDTNSYLKNRDKLANEIVKVIAKHFNLKLKNSVKVKNNSNKSNLAKITVSALNVRKEPNDKSKIVTVVKKNEVYTITEVKGNWGKLKSGAGWIYLPMTNFSNYPVDLTNSIGLYKFKTDTNIRYNPSTRSNVKRVAIKNSMVSITEIKNGWARISNKDEWFWLKLATQIKEFDVDLKTDTNIREKASINSKIVDRFIKAKSTKIIEIKNGWGLINSKKGWIWLGLTSLKK